MRYIKVNTAEPFVIVCDGEYQEQLAFERLGRYPFGDTHNDTQDSPFPKQYLEITLFNFLNLHSRPDYLAL